VSSPNAIGTQFESRGSILNRASPNGSCKDAYSDSLYTEIT
jgi:hypothetical protein